MNLPSSYRRFYQDKFKKYGINHKSLRWVLKKSQQTRFLQFVNHLDFNHQTVLDIGCGFADIVPHISKKAKNFTYTGIDLVPEFISVAQKKYPHHEFFTGNYFKSPLSQNFDIILCSGVLNTNLGQPQETISYRLKAIKTMFRHCRYGLAFNMAGAHPQPKNKLSSKIYYADSQKIKKFCHHLTPNLLFIKDYSPNDFTIILFH